MEDFYFTSCKGGPNQKIRRVLDWNQKIDSRDYYKILRIRKKSDDIEIGQVVLVEEESDPEGVIRFYYLAVDPELRGCGLGSILLDYAENYAKDNGFKKVKLNAQKENLDKLILFYLHRGYKQVSDVSFEKKL